MKINDQEGKTLMALRAGPTGGSELYERFPSGPSTGSLAKKGLIELKGGEWHITELGRELCPVRRQAKAPAEKTLPVLMQEQTVQKIARKPETISITPVFNIVKAVPTVKVVPEKEPEMTTPELVKAEKSKVLMMLEYIEQHPNCTSIEINEGLGFAVGKKFIPSYIEKGLVEVTFNSYNKNEFKLKEGWTAQAVYDTRRQLRNQAVPNVQKTEVHEAPATETTATETAPQEYEIKTFIQSEQSQPTQNDAAKNEPHFLGAVSALGYPAPAQSGGFRCAYTNDGCIMLLGIYPLPIELNAAQTNDLIEFISETITPIGVSM